MRARFVMQVKCKENPVKVFQRENDMTKITSYDVSRRQHGGKREKQKEAPGMLSPLWVLVDSRAGGDEKWSVWRSTLKEEVLSVDWMRMREREKGKSAQGGPKVLA